MSPDLISELEAAELSGVSTVTLGRFADAGYLNVEERVDGVRAFSKSELERVFGLTIDAESSDREFSTDEPTITSTTEIVRDISLHNSENQTAQQHDTAEIERAEQRTPQPSLDREVTRLSTIVELQEKYISLKEQELKNLREERDWLRSRIEKLEEKSDRDQLILVSISETNRGLSKAIENRKSPLKSALEWIGLLPAPDQQKSQQ